MRYVSIDLETCGLDYMNHDMLEIGAVIDDLDNPRPLIEVPKFHCYIVLPTYRGDPWALATNHNILWIIANKDKHTEKKFYIPQEVVGHFALWLTQNNYDPHHVNAAGKNFSGFDKNFLEWQLPGFRESIIFRHRTLDVGNMYFNPRIHKDKLPSMKECLTLSGIQDQDVKHTALEDAMLVCQLIRARYDVREIRESGG
jgi:oligoribonuclease